MFGRSQQTRWLVVGLWLLLSGCATDIRGMVTELDEHPADIELEQVPFYPQVTDQCGPAALASVLNTAGVAVTAADLKSSLYIPDRQGSLQLELTAATRQFARIPYTIAPHADALLAELAAGRPVLVLQNLGISVAPRWHYAVVVGYETARKQFVLRSGKHERLLMEAKTFLRTWQRGDFWGLVALEPGDLPAHADASQYLRSLAATESIGQLAAATPAYQVATERWPDNSLAWLGLGNALYAEGELQAAGDAYQQTLAIEPDHAIAMNNLSQVYLQQGCGADAIATIETALAQTRSDDPVREHLLQTAVAVRASRSASQCQRAN